MRFNISVSDEISSRCPGFRGMAVSANVRNSDHCDLLWEEIGRLTRELRERFTRDSIKDLPPIKATRLAYRACGKDPSRYRPSNEQLRRRILSGNPLYQVSTLVDLVNVVSIRHGFSIGGFDAEMIQGDELVLGIGREGEPYEGIGRGKLNIAGMPVYRDAAGGIGTPTSDHERTRMRPETTEFLALINGYSGEAGLRECAEDMARLLRLFADGRNIEINSYK